MKTKGTTKEEVRVGLDIGTRLIKAVEVASVGNIRKLNKFHVREISFPPSPEKTPQALKDLVEKFSPNTKEVNVALSAPHAIVRFINMPRMKEEDLRNSLKYEAEKYIPFNVNEVVIDVAILGEVAEDKNQMKVLLAAAKKDIINSRLALLKECGLSASLIDIDSFACFNAFSNTKEDMSKMSSTALLNMGYSQTNAAISNGAKPLFTRDIQIGIKDVLKAIAKALQVEEKDSEALLKNPPGEKAQEISDAVKTVLSTFTDELRLSFGYYENQYGTSINEIYLSGGMSNLSGMPEYLEENFGIKPQLWNPFEKFKIGPSVDQKALESVKSELAIATGLAIRK